MGVLIDTVRIAGFRGIRNVEISLPRVAVLIGTNNSGKTSVIKALQLALGDYSRYLTDEDFHIDSADVRSEEIVVDVRVVSVDQKETRQQVFETDWARQFGPGIQEEADGKQFLGIRTVGRSDEAKGGFIVEYYTLDTWSDFSSWPSKNPGRVNRIYRRYEALPFVSVDAQRDIHKELRDKTSFVGKILSGVRYDKSDVAGLEEMVAEINQEAVEKSEHLRGLRKHLNGLNRSFEGTGQAELTPFPKKIRDLSKRFSVHFGEADENSFSMEYHGMGTRSWASMLTVKAFADLMAESYEREEIPFSPVLAVEEPEAHLHPNAQKTLYRQMIDTLGQVIISTHSPHLATMASLEEIRRLNKREKGVEAAFLPDSLSTGDIDLLNRKVMMSRGDVLFAKALILFEGETEEQLIPAMFEQYNEGRSTFEKGITCISVAGKQYRPFIIFGCGLGIPVCIISDNDHTTKKEINSLVDRIRREDGLELGKNIFSLQFLSGNNDIEAELVNVLQIRKEIVEALVSVKTGGSDNQKRIDSVKKRMNALDEKGLLKEIKRHKVPFAGFLSDVIRRNPNERKKNELCPDAAIRAFRQIEEWLA